MILGYIILAGAGVSVLDNIVGRIKEANNKKENEEKEGKENVIVKKYERSYYTKYFLGNAISLGICTAGALGNGLQIAATSIIMEERKSTLAGCVMSFWNGDASFYEQKVSKIIGLSVLTGGLVVIGLVNGGALLFLSGRVITDAIIDVCGLASLIIRFLFRKCKITIKCE